MITVKTEIIENYITESKISKTEFCRKCKIGIKTLNKIYNKNDNFRIITLFKIARVLGINIQDLLNDEFKTLK